jgi:serine/threonine-protein kinase
VIASKCPSCSTNVPPDAPGGLCPTCLLRAGLGNASETIDPSSAQEMEDETIVVDSLRPQPSCLPAGTKFGDFELIERIAQGGMGVVYKARDNTLGRTVALKMILAGRFANDAEVQRFRHEAEAAANLDHSNIVPIYEIDECEGRQYFTMKFIEGGSLAAHMKKYSRDAVATARMLATVARAVHHGHRRGVLHRDLKPQNILIDETGQPHVTDFGVAKRITAEHNNLTQEGTVIGTPAYMAPEQASGQVQGITVEADVYSLGAILYEIITGRAAFQAESPLQLLRAVIDEQPVRPRQIDPNIDRDLETICLKCLEKDRKQRYRSAEELADELTRYANGEPVKAYPVGPAMRLWRWARRNPALAGGAVATLATLLAVVIAALTVARQRESQLMEEARRGNLWSARTAAISFLWQLDQFSRTIEKQADDPALIALLRDRDFGGARRWLVELSHRHGADEGFESWFLQDGSGAAIGRAPEKMELVGRDFSARDYYVGARRHIGAHGPAAVHVSRVFRSEADGLYKFALSAPVWVSGQTTPQLLGVITATMTTASTMGSLRLNDERREAVLVGRIDPSVREAEASAPYRILVHPAYHRRDEAAPLDNRRLQSLPRPNPDAPELQLSPAAAPRPRAAPSIGASVEGMTDDFYTDPMSQRDSRYGGRWLAAFAPVGNTEMVVIVQQRYDEVIQPDKTLTRNLALALGSALAIGLLFTAAVAWYGSRRRNG